MHCIPTARLPSKWQPVMEPGRNLVVVDTPGLREVGLWGDGSGLQQTFADIVELASGCRFSDCQHGNEPDCAVRRAIEDGRLEARRLDSMRRLEAEQAATARRQSEHERRAHERDFSRMVKKVMKAKRERR